MELKENCDRQIVNLPQSTAPLLHPRSSEKFQMVSKPLGIGLHLNRIVNAASVGCTTNSGKKSTDHDMGVQRTKSGMASNNLAENTQNCSVSSSAAEKDSASNEERAGVIKSSIVPSSVPNDNMGNQFAAPNETGKSDSQNADSLEERDQLSPRKKRLVACSYSIVFNVLNLVSFLFSGLLVCLCSPGKKQKVPVVVMDANVAIVRKPNA